MRSVRIGFLLCSLVPVLLSAGSCSGFARATPLEGTAPDLATLADRGALGLPGRSITAIAEGEMTGAHITPAVGDGIAWLEGIEFETGTIELDVRGKDLPQQSFVGMAFGGIDDESYEAVYLRPFNFRATDPVRKAHAVQYISAPTYTWQNLRTEHPGVYENAVDPAPDPNSWVALRIVVEPSKILTYVGDGSEPDLVVDRLGDGNGRKIGLWVGNNSGGDFANLRITPER